MGTAALLACMVIGIADGDTLTARCDTPHGAENLKVRLAEIDAPERGQPWGDRSKRHLAELCFKKSATVAPVSSDRYGRTVARVHCDGVDANAEQVRTGLAWVFSRYVTDWTLYTVQRDAMVAKAGLWADQHPVPPWEWRDSQRGARR